MKTLYLIDRENGNAKKRISRKFLADFLNGDGSGPVTWNRNNIDLDRCKFELDEIGYDLIIKEKEQK